MGPVVSIDNVSKRFRLYKDKPQSAKERVIRMGRHRYEEFWALQNVSFDVQQGETVGLLGHNGSGKSTLLKCVAGTLRPTSGRIEVAGRLAALLELGAGFHGDLTGRENMYMNASILGFTRRDVDLIFDEIVGFAELENFIDLPVKHYSSGMVARLGFAVAIHVDPEVLLVDEVLSVGDEAFQRKCMDRIKTFQKEGRTIFLVTHAADLVRQLCDRAAVLDHGELVCVGDPNDAVRMFRETLLKRGIEIPVEAAERKDENLLESVKFTSCAFEFPEGRQFLRTGEPLRLHLGYQAAADVDDCIFALSIYDQDGNMMMSTNSELLHRPTPVRRGPGEVVLDFPNVPLLDGHYPVSVAIHDPGGNHYDYREQALAFDVQSSGKAVGRVQLEITLEQHDGAPSAPVVAEPAAS